MAPSSSRGVVIRPTLQAHVTDNRSGLVWLKNADCLDSTTDWFTAMEFVAGLADLPADSRLAGLDCDLSDGSSAGEWRLPSPAEWEAMVEDAVEMGCSPTITNDRGTACWAPFSIFSSFRAVRTSFYWSSMSTVIIPTSVWVVDLETGVADTGLPKGITLHFWPVRGGQ